MAQEVPQKNKPNSTENRIDLFFILSSSGYLLLWREPQREGWPSANSTGGSQPEEVPNVGDVRAPPSGIAGRQRKANSPKRGLAKDLLKLSHPRPNCDLVRIGQVEALSPVIEIVAAPLPVPASTRPVSNAFLNVARAGRLRFGSSTSAARYSRTS
jgi:hypothetical protein